MEKIWEFTLDPKPETFEALKGSMKARNILGDVYTSWEAAVLYKYHSKSGWEKYALSAEKKKQLFEKFQKDTIDVISKLVAQPRLGLVHKAWGLFWATGEIKYLSAAFEAAGNQRSTNSLKREAIKIFTEAQDYYREHVNDFPDKVFPPCVAAFLEFESQLADQQARLKKLHEEGNLGTQMVDTSPEGVLKREAEEKRKQEDSIDELLKKIEGDEDDPEIKREKKKEKDLEEATELFDNIIQEVFTKVK
jgi:hypothetical protein